jgi:hypothetical protein
MYYYKHFLYFNYNIMDKNTFNKYDKLVTTVDI